MWAKYSRHENNLSVCVCGGGGVKCLQEGLAQVFIHHKNIALIFFFFYSNLFVRVEKHF